MMLLYALACILVVTACSATPSHPRLKVHLRGVVKAENRLKRSLLAIGASAAKALIDGAKFVYSNGLHRVFIKPGGYQRAHKDFTSVNNINPVKLLPNQGQLQTMGRVGDRKLILRENRKTGTTVLQISKIPARGYHTTIDPFVDTIIVYTDKI